MKIGCELVLRFEDADVAETVAKALSIENEGYVEQTVKGAAINARISAPTLRALRSTIDDYLACARVAELNAKKGLTSR